MNPSLNFWHVAALSRQLKRAPLRVQVAGEEIALFRDGQGGVGAVLDSCPHRHMRLSEGRVENGRIVCPYHGWAFDRSGQGLSPSSPGFTVDATCFKVREAFGAIWLQQADSKEPFPNLDVDGDFQFCALSHQVDAPLELIVDNMNEAEHGAFVHVFVGFTPDRFREINFETKFTDDSVEVHYSGEQRPLPILLRKAIGRKPGDIFDIQWAVRFAPVHFRYLFRWMDHATGEVDPKQVKICYFYNPLDEQRTQFFTFGFATAAFAGNPLSKLFFRTVITQLLDGELQRDVRMVNRLADKNPNLRGMKLGRFDKPLYETRQKIDRIYRRGGRL